MRIASSARRRSSREKIQLAPGTDVTGRAASSSTPETSTRYARRRRPDAIEHGAERHALPVRGAHQPVVGLVDVARALDQVASARTGERLERRQGEIDGRVRPGRRRECAHGAGARQRRRRGGPDEEAIVRVTRDADCGSRIADCGSPTGPPSSDRSVKSRASRPEPSRRPKGGAGTPPGFPSGTALMKRARRCLREKRRQKKRARQKAAARDR